MRRWVWTLAFIVSAGCTPAAQSGANDGETSNSSVVATLEQHLASEARRLAAKTNATQQPDTRWVADKLGSKPDAALLANLLNLRRDAIDREYAERVRQDYSEFWDYPARLVPTLSGRNGMDDLREVVTLADALCEDTRFKNYVSLDPDLVHMKPELALDLLAESKPIAEAMSKAAKADHVTWVAARPNTIAEWEWDVPAYSAFKVATTRIHALAQAGATVDAIVEATALTQAVSALRTHCALIGALVHVVVVDALVRHTLIRLAESGKVPPDVLTVWADCGRKLHVDVLLALAIEVADRTRLRTEPGQLEWDFSRQLARDNGFVSVEDAFVEYRRNGEGAIALLHHVRARRSRIDTPDGLRAALSLATTLPFLIQGNLFDAAAAHWIWAALEVRVCELEPGSAESVTERIERVVDDWPALKAQWKGQTLELWVSESVGYKQDDPLIRLPLLHK